MLRSRSFIGVVAVGRRAVGKADRPDAVDGDRLSIFILEQAYELYFTGGPNQGTGGLFGYLIPVKTELVQGNSQ